MRDAETQSLLQHSLGSLNELEYDLLLARDLGFLLPGAHERLGRQLKEVRRMLSGLMAQLIHRTP